MSFYERFYGFRALSIIGKCTSRHLFAYGGLRGPCSQRVVVFLIRIGRLEGFTEKKKSWHVIV